jgi:2-polyprenyl-6-methoxyphenol hydroxylase-like FAD-dependent oxidoreductase
MSPTREPTPTFPYVCVKLLSACNYSLTGQLTPCSLDQSRVEGILRDNLARRFHVIVELGTELIHFEQTKDQVLVRLRKTTADGSTSDEETLVQYLIGTDGGRSTVRKTLGLTFDGETAKEVIIYGDVVLKGLDEDHWHMFGAVTSKMLELPLASEPTHSDSILSG